MAELTVKEFIDVVHRSRLIDKDQLIGALSVCKQGGQLPEDADTLADCLRQQGLLTPWQQQNLLAGKSHGFFLGKYKLLRHLGTGGVSSVFLAEHALIGRQVAIKVLPSGRVGVASSLDRFLREARATARLSHSNIVRVYDIDQQGDTHFMVMEYVSGQDLKAMVAEHGPLPLDKAAQFIAQAATGLQHAHDRGLVHRDIKPANLVVNKNDIVKILDLGLARLDDDDEVASLTIENSENVMGTADYLAPEQARNCHEVDHRADIYSLGCTFYYLLTGHPPFTEGTMAQRMLKHQTEKPRDVRADREDCPHALADVCMTMLAKDPDQRYASASVVSHRLYRWLYAQGFTSTQSVASTLSDAQYLETGMTLPLARPVPSTPTVAHDNTTLSDERRARHRRTIRTPLGLWIFLGVSAVVCIGLLLYVLLVGMA